MAETAEAAIARELKDEAGLVPPERERYAVVPVHDPDDTNDQITALLGHWDCEAQALPLTEGVLLRWFPASVISRLVMCLWADSVVEQHQWEKRA